MTGTGRVVRSLLATAALLSFALLPAAAWAAGPQVSVLYPMTGFLSSVPPHHHAGPSNVWGNFSLDDAPRGGGGAGTPVYANFGNANGTLRLELGGSTYEPCAAAGTGGLGLVVNVYLDGQLVGRVAYSHLAGITRTSGEIANGAQIGVLTGSGALPCWSAPHVHVEPYSVNGAACFVSRPQGANVDTGMVLGVIGGGYANGSDQACPAGAEWFVGSIVRWNGDTQPQKTSWLVGQDHHRRWIPDTRTFNCLRARGVGDAGALAAALLAQLGDLNGIWAQCPPGDTDYNGRVDIYDLSRLLSDYNHSGALHGDDNYDNTVDIYDLSILLSNYGRTS